jgi:hypothetical protein
MKITGLDTLQKNLADAQKALAALDGELGSVNFNPHDPSSIEAAIAEVERMVDERLGAYASNPIVGPLAEQMKEKYREGILAKAAEARSAGGSSDDAE